MPIHKNIVRKLIALHDQLIDAAIARFQAGGPVEQHFRFSPRDIDKERVHDSFIAEMNKLLSPLGSKTSYLAEFQTVILTINLKTASLSVAQSTAYASALAIRKGNDVQHSSISQPSVQQ